MSSETRWYRSVCWLTLGFVVLGAVFSAGYPLSADAALSTGPTGQKSWYWQNPLPQGNTLYGVDTSGSNVWAVGASGTVLHSDTDGVQWDAVDVSATGILRDVDFVSDQIGWVVGEGSVVRKTTNGGLSWAAQTVPSVTSRGISMADTQTGWIVGTSGSIRKTANGTTWATQSSGTTRTLNGVDAADSTHAWVAGGSTTTDGVILATTDGITWAAQSIPTTQGINGIDFVDTQVGYAVGNRDTTNNTGTVLKTTDGGVTWELLSVVYPNNLGVPTTLNTTMRAVAFRDDRTGWIAGDSGLVLFTQDGGATWESQKSGSLAIQAMCVGDDAKAHIVGTSGMMLRTDTDGSSWRGQQQGTTSRLNSAAWTGPTAGVVVGAAGLVMKTEDAGDSWASRTLGPNDIYDVHFNGTSTGWLVGSAGFVRKTTDYGSSWLPQVSGTTETLYAAAVASPLEAWACGANGTIIRTTDGGDTWAALSSGTTQTLNDIYFVDENRGWVVGTGGTVRITTDGGDTWSAQPSGITSTINAVRFVDENTGWIVGATGRIRKTTNGGATWTAQTTGTTLALYSVEMVDADTGWAVGGTTTGSVVLRTSNGGTTWVSQDAGYRGTIRHVTARDAQTAGIVGDAGAMRRTFDGGATWETTGFWSASNYRAVDFATSNEGWAVGDSGVIAHTHDGGITWGAQQSGGTSALYDVDFVSGDKGWAVGASGAIRTTVSHTTWATQTSPVAVALRGVSFVDETTGWIVGASGTVLKTVDGGTNWVAQTSGVPGTVTLYGVKAIDAQRVYAWGSSGRFISTTDGGATWTSATITGVDLNTGFFVDAQTGWVAGGSGTVLKTVNGGANWTSQTANAGTNALWDITFLDAQTGYIVGAAGVVRKTVDGGTTWTTQLPGTINALYGVAFTDSDHGWIVGATGTILRSTDNTPPQTGYAIEPASPDGTDGWWVTTPAVTLASDEPGLTFYSWASATGPWTTYAAPVTPLVEGAATLHFYSVDPGGNKETVQSLALKSDTVAPSTPSMPSVTTQSATELLLTWSGSIDAVSGVAYYQVRNNESVLGTSPVTSMSLTNLPAETTYSLNVTAVDAAGNASARSGSATASTLAHAVRPPSAVLTNGSGSRGITVNWVESTGTVPPVSYRVWRSVDAGPFSAVATITAADDLSFLDEEAPRLTPLRYAVSAVDARGEGPRSVASELASANVSVLPPPLEITPRNTQSVTVTWTPSPTASAYHVYRSTTSTGTASQLTTQGPVATTSFHDDTTLPSTEYWYAVASVDASDNVGSPSPRVYIKTVYEGTSETTTTPHGLYDRDTNLCAVCHRTHSATGPMLLVGTTTIDAPLCLSCHDGTSASDVMSDYADATRTSRHPVPMPGNEAGSLQCSSCHGVHSAGGEGTVKGLLLAGGQQSGNAYCYSCHGEQSALPRGDLRGFDTASHGTSIAKPASGTKVVCLSCHVGHTSREPSLYPYAINDRCLRCHSFSNPSGYEGDIAERLSGAEHTTRHDLLEEDGAATGARITCANCHEPHTSSETTPCVDPDSPTSANPLSAGGVTLCLRCHDGSLPTSQDTSGWASAPLGPGGSDSVADIASVWSTNFHGGGGSVSPQLDPAMGFSAGDELECKTCHDPHGSVNRFALLESIPASGSPAVAQDLAVAPAGSGWDLRFFCDACHDLTPATHTAADISGWPVNCTASGCHTHAQNGL